MIVSSVYTKTALLNVADGSVTAWKYPPGCETPSCEYDAEWRLDEETDFINFTIHARQPVTQWTAIAFAPLPRMVIQSLVVLSDIY